MKKLSLNVLLSVLVVLAFATVALAEHPKQIYTIEAPAPVGFYSQGIKFGNLVFVSGQIPLNCDPSKMMDTGNATTCVMHNIGAILDEAGLDLGDIIMTTVYLSPIAVSAEFNKAYGEAFGCECTNSPTCSQWNCGRKPKFVPPARATIFANKLPGTVNLIEVSVIAGK
jgi:2-iminobutanoate/2-iminopropanoate deaminase